jgi:hypothetical protein
MTSRLYETNGMIDRWIGGLARLDQPDMLDEAAWEQATEVFYGRTQEFVHVIGGGLKSSGRRKTVRNADRIVGEVAYGGTPECDYAVYEFRRGGAHDALGRGAEVTNRLYEATLAKIVEDKVGRWG